MQNRNLLAAVSLLWLLGACQVPITSAVSPEAETVSDTATDSSAPVTCDLPDAPSPLTTRENQPAYDQFNFRPQSIEITDGIVAVKTPYYTFSFCQGDSTWSITSTEAVPAEDSYSSLLQEMANPTYKTIEVNGEPYQYRIRLQADWLDEQIRSESDPSAVSPPVDRSDGDNAVHFELKTPDGNTIDRQLYTLEDLKAADLGASLGPPRIAGAVAVGDDIWLAATAEQGEGNSGFASLIRYRTGTGDLTVQQPDQIQGDQFNAIAATGSPEDPTLWLGTQIAGEGNPYIPAHGLVAYKPTTENLTTYTVSNSPMVGAIPFQLAVAGDSLWVGTGNGVCQVPWQTPNAAESWNCWQFTATASLPAAGVDLYPSFLADESATTLTQSEVEVLWLSQAYTRDGELSKLRYEVVYEPGFETQLVPGGYQINEVAFGSSEENSIFWAGRQWHWNGDRFVRGLDEVSLSLFGGGPYGLTSSDEPIGITQDADAIRGDFDLLLLTEESTQVRYYSGWVEGDSLEVYPKVVPTTPPATVSPNPLNSVVDVSSEGS